MISYTLALVLFGSLILGITAGTLGSFAVLRKQSLLGDTISHAALPGVALAFLFTLSKNPLILVLGALLAGWIGTILIMLITKYTHLKHDSAMGIVLSVFFGLGIFLLSIIQRLPTAKKAGLDTFLFGNASTLLKQDVITMFILGGISLLLVFLFWKEFKVLSFDSDFAHSTGIPTIFTDILLTTIIVISIVIGLQSVGVVLMSALVIAPAVAARQWTDHLGKMVFLSAFFGAIGGVLGAYLSSHITKLPTGPTIVVIISVIVAISLFFSPHRGLFKDWIVQKKNKKRVHIVRVLMTLLNLSKSHEDPFTAHPLSSLRATNPTSVEGGLIQLQKMGYVHPQNEGWSLTPLGLKEAKRISSTLFGDSL